VIEILAASRASQNDQLLNELKELKEVYSEVVIEFNGTEKDSTREITSIKVSDDQIRNITSAVERIRNRIIKA
jgi:hypothetical protein